MVMAGSIFRGLHRADALGAAATGSPDLNGQVVPCRVSTGYRKGQEHTAEF